MSMISNKSYKELYEILSYMDKMTVMKIPMNVLIDIKNKKEDSYITRIDKNDIFNEKNVNRETIDMLCYFYKKYWSI